MEQIILDFISRAVIPSLGIGVSRRIVMLRADRWNCTTKEISDALRNLESLGFLERNRVNGMVHYTLSKKQLRVRLKSVTS